MDHIFVRSNFADQHGFRLLCIDDAWARQLTEHVYPSRASAKRETRRVKRRRVSVVLVMKGEEQLCLHDALTTRSVRRVEYSNAMLLAKRRLSSAGRAALRDAPVTTADAAPTPPQQLPVEKVRQLTDDVVLASLSRMFDSHAAHPQANITAVLGGAAYLTIDELEGHGDAAPRGCTFAQLARVFCSSPAELADALQAMGAVVHRGRVRLLHPSLVHESLRATLAFLDAADPADATWAAVRAHLCPSVYPEVVVRSLEAVYGAPPAAPQRTDDVTLLGMPALLDVPQVLVGLAGSVFDGRDGVVLRTLGGGEVARGLPLDVFVPAWTDAIPSTLLGVGGLSLRGGTGASSTAAMLALLRGSVVVESRSSGSSSATVAGVSAPATVWWLPRDDLSSDFATRLRTLFELRPQRWDLADLCAYLGVLLPPDQSFEHVILRYAREYRVPGQSVQYAPLT